MRSYPPPVGLADLHRIYGVFFSTFNLGSTTAGIEWLMDQAATSIHLPLSEGWLNVFSDPGCLLWVGMFLPFFEYPDSVFLPFSSSGDGIFFESSYFDGALYASYRTARKFFHSLLMGLDACSAILATRHKGKYDRILTMLIPPTSMQCQDTSFSCCPDFFRTSVLVLSCYILAVS